MFTKLLKNVRSKASFSGGFTLIETFVAIVILMIIVVGPMMLLSKAISYITTTENQGIAYFLAQEGLESVINQRDNNISNSSDYLTGLDCVSSVCAADAYASAGNKVFQSSDSQVYLTFMPIAGTGDMIKAYRQYSGHSAGTKTLFQRTITITKNTKTIVTSLPLYSYDPGFPYSLQEVTVTVTVWWEQNGHHQVVLSTVLLTAPISV